jgi:hypothetical protein
MPKPPSRCQAYDFRMYIQRCSMYVCRLERFYRWRILVIACGTKLSPDSATQFHPKIRKKYSSGQNLRELKKPALLFENLYFETNKIRQQFTTETD